MKNVTIGIVFLAILTLASCGQPVNDREKLKSLTGIELCPEATVTETKNTDDESYFRFDVVYEFEVAADQQCLAEFTVSIDESQQCEKFPNQLACRVEDGDTLILNQGENNLSITYAT